MMPPAGSWRTTILAVAGAASVAACGLRSVQTEPAPATTLKDAYARAFLIGAALAQPHFDERDPAVAALITRQFNSISPENVLKWERVAPRPDAFEFGAADRYVAFGEKHGMQIIGHTLVWHSQTPRWVFEDGGRPATRDTLLARMRTHIHAVVGRYKGRIHGWDVVNEALDNDGSLRNSPWLRIIGEDYIAKAFEFAHEADPSAELYYNDYSLDSAPKRHGAVRLMQSLRARGVQIAGIGLQGHYKRDWPSVAEVDSTIGAFAALGLKVMITELDVDLLPRPAGLRDEQVSTRVAYSEGLDPYRLGVPDSVRTVLARRYADIFAVYLAHRDAITRVTFWGVTDAGSWLNGWPIPGRTSYPLLFDRQGSPKPAFDAVLAASRTTRTRR